MFQSVGLMIFILIPTLTFAAGNVVPQFATLDPSRGSDWCWCYLVVVIEVITSAAGAGASSEKAEEIP